MDSLAGMDMKKIEEMITTALMLDQVSHDETIMVNVLKEAEAMLDKKDYTNCEQILRDGFTYEKWRDKFGAHLLTGIAWC
jgi:uncharacterized protein YqgQ